MESLDLRNLVEYEVEYKELDKSVIDKAVLYIKGNDRLMQMLDLIVEEAINSCK